MEFMISRVFFKIRKKDMLEAKELLKFIKIEKILNSISKDCWRYGIQYEVLYKSKDALIIKFKGLNNDVLLKYVKGKPNNIREVQSLLKLMQQHSVYRGSYIFTGDIENRKYILDMVQNFEVKLKIVDGAQLVVKNLGLTKNIFNIKSLCFEEYLPQ